jgi:hypothetical protein
MRPLALLFLMFVVACSGAPKPDPEPDPPPSGDLFALETTPTKANFVVLKGSSAVLEVRSKIFSPSVDKVKVIISGSTGASIDPKEVILTGNSSAQLTVSVPSDTTVSKPFFRVEGLALNERDDPITANSVSILFQWDLTTPPPAVK